MGLQRVNKLLSNRGDRVEKASRILQNHANLAPTNLPHLGFLELSDFCSGKLNAALNGCLSE